MILSCKTYPLSHSNKRKKVKAEITTDPSKSSHGKPVIVLEDGYVLDATDWVVCDYLVINATEEEFKQLWLLEWA